MKRSRVILEAVILAFLGALLPLFLTIYGAWSLSLRMEEDRLMDIASQATTRAERSFLDAAATLKTLGGRRFISCTDAHIGEMRRLVVNSRTVEEIGYIEDGMLKCTSWGPENRLIKELAPDFVVGKDIKAWVDVIPMVTGANPMSVVQVGPYNALVDPARLVEGLADQDASVVVTAPNGVISATLNTPDTDFTDKLGRETTKGTVDGNIYAVNSKGGWTAIAISSTNGLFGLFSNEHWFFVAFGTFATIVIIGLVIRMSRKRLSPLGELSIAVRKREFVVHYQPIIALSSGVCIGAEALVRWQRPDGSLVRPDLFIPLAEQSGLIRPITDQVIEAIGRDIGPLLKQHRSLHVAINFCADDFKTGRVLETVGQRLGNSGIANDQIWLEATERGLMDIDEARKTIAEARMRGYAVAIDDFGTGYSSLQYLQSLPLDALKIDKSFVDAINRQTATSAVIAHIIEMAKSLKLSIIAEGVETREQAEYLLDHGVEFCQGWFYAKALPAAEFIDYVETSLKRQDSGVVMLSRTKSTNSSEASLSSRP
ncbi:EAL domain-containing protein [Neorhizobium sp. JUb45]|uniref:EAL domain-containing protein n=1 Tax=unclassified Neorhizobium TaxID=2629175 RepID=UPI001047643B|nr:EAL domain-containing protein [Neorhizobium sp. JUb45]TCR03072.1 sensor c-di-GMP phosphodiesterase-like protein [Neorhizobium sp. JUb45]